MKPGAFLAATLLLLAAAAQAQQAAPPLGEGDTLVDLTYRICRAAPLSALCAEAEEALQEETIDSLLAVGEGTRAEGRDVVVSYLDHPVTEIRLAAVAALGRLRPDASDTPLLLVVLNDPVPAIRSAALAALYDSSDPATIPIVDRSLDDQGSSLLPDPPPDPAWLGTGLPPEAEPLRFTDDRADGVIAFVTPQAPQQVLDYYSALVGRAPVPLGDARSALLPDWAEAGGMGFYQEFGQRMQGLESLPLPEMLLAQQRMAQLMALAQQGILPEELERWRDTARWGEVRLLVLAVEPRLEMPTQLLLAYEDRQLGRAGFALQWLPASTIPAAPVPAGETALLEEQPDYGAIAAEAQLWSAVTWSGMAGDYEAYLEALPEGAHAAGARAALERLRDEAQGDGQQEQQQSGGQESGQTAEESTPPLPSERKTITTDAGVTLAADSPLLPQTPVVVGYSGLDPQRSPWLTVVPAGTPDTQWTDWAHTYAAEGTLTLPGQRAGDYEIRALLEAPREVVARLAVTVLSTASGPPALALAGEVPTAGQPIVVRFSNLPGGSSDWISVVKAGAPDSRWDDWAYTRGKTEGEITLKGQPAGDYELRAYTERPKREVLVRLPLTILP